MAARNDEPNRALAESSRLAAFARSLGSAVGMVKGWMPTLRAKRPVAGTQAEGALANLEMWRKRLRGEIAELEGELERLHTMITGSAMVGGAAQRPSQPSVDALLTRSRQLRDRLHEKRYRLARVERSIAREQRLGAVAPSAPLERPRRFRRRAAEKLDRARRGHDDARVRAVFSAVEKALFENRSAKLGFKRLAESLVHDNPNTRREAVTRLAESDNPAAFDLLMVAVGDRNERVRLAALNALAGMNRAAPADLFRGFLRDRNSSLRLAALRGLASMGSGVLATTELTSALEDGDPAVRKTAATVLGWHRAKGRAMALVFPALALALRDEEESVRIAAAEALGSLCDARAVLPLIRALTDASPRVREEAQRALRSTVGEEIDLIGEGLSADERVAALKTWWTDARVHVVVGRDAAATEPYEAPIDDRPESDEQDEAGSEDFERLMSSEAGDQPSAGAGAPPAAPAPTPIRAPREAERAAPTPAKEPAAAPGPKKETTEAKPEGGEAAASPGGQFENLFPDNVSEDAGETSESDGEYEDPFGSGDGS